ncbi:MAG: asparagine synthase (glutamine-hydrolyzing) [Agathobacter sp.]|nr:asparagine synthase (glutamine-hydrolyzing) [Agathobacter sp.]
MSSIAGFFQPNTVYSKENEFCIKTIHDMSQALIHRGPDEQSYYYFPQGAYNQNFLLAGYIPGTFSHEIQPITISYHGNTYTLLLDGFISNPEHLAMELEIRQISTKDMSLEKLLLFSFLTKGEEFIKEVRGAFAMAIYDEGERQLYLFRDALGLRPLFYTEKAQALIFASEIKALFQYPGLSAVLDRDGLTELLSLGPARKPGSAIFKGIYEVKPGHYLTYSRSGCKETVFHHFEIKEHQDSYEDTKENICYLLNQSLDSLKCAVMPVSSFLSGGLDSSIVTAKLANVSPSPLATYSLEFDNSRQHFKSNAFQPALDAPFVQEMATHLGTKHTIYTCNNQIQLDYLKKSVLAHDLPTMADVDSSYLYFCEMAGKQHKIVFTGECADEIFCGYPWYHGTETDCKTFPWSTDLSPRESLLRDDLIKVLPIEECVRSAYLNTCNEIGLDGENTPADMVHRKTFYLTIRYFMQTLVNRGDRAAAANSMDARVPFAHQELTEYLFNVPFEMKAQNGERKHLLREYAMGLLPEEIRTRKKSPYPKTYDPGYEALINQELLRALSKTDCPLHAIVDKRKAETFCRQVKDLGRPWYGQLMAGPQLVAHYLQILYWIEMYNIEIQP